MEIIAICACTLNIDLYSLMYNVEARGAYRVINHLTIGFAAQTSAKAGHLE